MAIKLTTYGATTGLNRRITVRLTHNSSTDAVDRADLALIIPQGQDRPAHSKIEEFAAIITNSEAIFEESASGRAYRHN